MIKNTFFFILTLLLLNSCIIEDESPTSIVSVDPGVSHSYYDPVILKRDQFEGTTKLIAPRKVVNSGKIYVKDNFLFVGEANEGFHIFDNTDPKNPVNKAFLKVLGASDLSIKGSMFYINNAVDLIALKPDETLTSIEITKRVPNIFPQLIAPNGQRYYNLKEDEIIVNWIKKN